MICIILCICIILFLSWIFYSFVFIWCRLMSEMCLNYFVVLIVIFCYMSSYLKFFRDVKLHVFKSELFRNGACNPKKWFLMDFIQGCRIQACNVIKSTPFSTHICIFLCYHGFIYLWHIQYIINLKIAKSHDVQH